MLTGKDAHWKSDNCRASGSIKRQPDVQPPAAPGCNSACGRCFGCSWCWGVAGGVWAWGVAIFFLTVGFAIYVRHVKSALSLMQHTMAALGLLLVIALLCRSCLRTCGRTPRKLPE